jgi:hypothetical protein
MLQSYEGYIEKGHIYPMLPLKEIKGRRRVIITVLDEPADDAKEKPQAKAWREFFEAVNASDEPLPESFERVSFKREVEL